MSGFPTAAPVAGEVSPEALAAVLFNEQRALEGPGVEDAYPWMAHAALNRIHKLKKPLGSGVAPPKIGRVWPNERAALGRARRAARQAIEERNRGKDPTAGALFWQHRSVDPRWSPEFAKDYFKTKKYRTLHSSIPLARSKTATTPGNSR